MERDGRGAHHATLEDWWNLIAFVIGTTTIPLQSEHNISIYTPLHTVPTTSHNNIFVGYSWPARVDKERLQKLERVAAEFYAQECSAERYSL